MYPVYNKFYYKPLPTCIEVRQSSIEGLGLFAINDIDKDFDLGMSHIKVPIICGYIRTPIGGFLNHSKDYNSELSLELDWDDYKTFNVYTTKKIKSGEELTLNYHIDDLIYED
jgi:hypothetical protein